MAKLPDKIGNFTIEKLIAKGGMGAVYKAQHPTLNRHVVIKKLTMRGNSSITERFKREARIMMDFRHEGIVTVYDHFREGNSYYIALEYVDGISLEALIQQERYLPNCVALYIFNEAAKALEYAHSKGVIHRDIKPANILIARDGTVKLVDFGIASSKEETEQNLTRDGMTLGTPSYMAPEQFQNTKNVDERADIYSMGVMLYEMVTGKKPFPGSFSAELLATIQKGRYVKPSKYNPKLSPLVKRIINKCIRAKSKRRYKNLVRPLKLLKSYVKKQNPARIKKIIRSYVAGKKVQVQDRTTINPRILLIAGIVAAVIGLSSIGAWAYYNDMHKEYLFAGDYGAVVLEYNVNTLKSAKSADEILIASKIFIENKDSIDLMSDVSFEFYHNKLKSGENAIVFTSKKLYLPEDQYRFKVILENGLFWHSVTVRDRNMQRSNPATAEFLFLEHTYNGTGRLPLEVGYSATDMINGNDITDSVKAAVNISGSWVDLRKVPDKLYTDTIYNFRLSKNKYYNTFFTLRIRPGQPVLNLQAEMIPHPGALVVSCDVPGIKIKIDNRDYYFEGGPEYNAREIPSLEQGANTFYLNPGTYQLQLARGSKKQTVPVTIDSGVTARKNVSYSTEEKKLLIK